MSADIFNSCSNGANTSPGSRSEFDPENSGPPTDCIAMSQEGKHTESKSHDTLLQNKRGSFSNTVNTHHFQGIDNFGVNFSTNEIASKLPILANALSVAAPFRAGIQTDNAEVFLMTPDGTLKRKLINEDMPSKRKQPTVAYMPGTSIPYRTPGQSLKNRNGKIKRPMNAFMIWARTARTKLATETPNASNAEISVKLGEVWSKLPREEKQKFYMEAERVKAKHRQDFPDWIYQPEPPKKGNKAESNHQTLWDQYNENRPKVVQKSRPTPQGPFIKYVGQPNRPILPRNVYPLQPVTIMPQGNQFGVAPRMPFVQQLASQAMFVQRDPGTGNYLRQFVPYQSNTPRLHRPAGNLDYNSVQNVTIIHPKGAVSTTTATKGRPNTVSEKVKVVQDNLHVRDEQTELTVVNQQSLHEDKMEKNDSNLQGKEANIKKTSDSETPKKTQKKGKKNEKGSDKKSSTKQKQKGSATKTTKESARNIGDECEVPTLPGSSTQPNDEHPDDFWPFPFPPAEQESHMNMFEGHIHESGEEGDPYTTYLCPVKSKSDDGKLHVDVSGWQQYLRHDQQQKPTEKLDAYFVDKAEVVSCPSDLDICPVPVALTLARQDSKPNDKFSSSFGSSISNALNVLEGDSNDECSEDATVMQIDSKGNLTESTINMKDIEILQQNDNNQMRSINQSSVQYAVNSEVDTRPFKKRTNRYFQDMEENLVIVE